MKAGCFLFLLILLCACAEQPTGIYQLEYRIEDVSKFSEEDYSKFINQINSRFNKTEFSNSEIYFEGDLLKVNVPIYKNYKNTAFKVQALFTNSSIEFWDAYSLTDVIFSEIDSLAKNIEHFIPNSRKRIKYSSSAIGFSASRDHLTTIAMDMAALFNHNDNIEFYWSTEISSEYLPYPYILYAINKRKDRNLIPLNNSVINSAYSREDPMNPNKFEILLEFDERGKEAWSIMTKNAAQMGKKGIAIIVDKQVVACPFVRSEITGGRTSIAGEYSKEESEELAFKLSLSPLDYNLILVNDKLLENNLK